jgi:hypothetical protein
MLELELPRHVALAEDTSEMTELIRLLKFNGVVIPAPKSFTPWSFPGPFKFSAIKVANWREQLTLNLATLNPTAAALAPKLIAELEELAWIIRETLMVSDEECNFDIVAQEDVGKTPHVDHALVAFKVLLGPGIVIYPDQAVTMMGENVHIDLNAGIELSAGATLVFRGDVAEADIGLGEFENGLYHKGPTLSPGQMRLAVRVFCKLPAWFPNFPED